MPATGHPFLLPSIHKLSLDQDTRGGFETRPYANRSARGRGDRPVAPLDHKTVAQHIGIDLQF